MKIVIPGGSGKIGTVLARALHAEGHEVAVLTRNPSVAPWRMIKWDGQTLGKWADECALGMCCLSRSGCLYAARQARETARQLPPGKKRKMLLRSARDSEAAAQINRWTTSPGAQAAEIADGRAQRPHLFLM